MARNNVSRSRANQPLYRLIDDIIRSAGEPAIVRQMIPPGTRIDWPVEDLATYEARCHSMTPLQVNSIVDFSALDFAGAVDDCLICPICIFTIMTPVVIPCNHIFCLECLQRHYEISQTCPIDRKKFRANRIRLSKDIAEQLGNLIVFCPNYPRGCTKQTRRRDVLTHALNCSHMSS
ncbi:hypothetical protein QL093DRAFT_2550276, partial [Fusarium oxysporum]